MHYRLILGLAVGFLIAADPPQGRLKNKDLKDFQGTWVLQSAEKDGKIIPVAGKNIKLVIKGTNYALTEKSSAVIGQEGTFVLDPSTKPKTTEVIVKQGPDKGKKFLGIYEISGDLYIVCFAPPGQPRPMKFATGPGTGHLFQTWKREKK